ncbi:hypothetical protein JCGZ_20248 [Jatropha curcas]|uniref:Uncharacterized protein n=1 Tax=Jatropha curcas TaxID=180498 RepID=A0A067K580_JATCU|nr:hypothetical protein JCGZ_20248 [Jatropha curcas]
MYQLRIGRRFHDRARREENSVSRGLARVSPANHWTAAAGLRPWWLESRGRSKPNALHTIWLDFPSRVHFWPPFHEIGTPVGRTGLGSGLVSLSSSPSIPTPTTASLLRSVLAVN